MSTLATTNLKHPSSGSNNIVLAADGTTTITAPSNIIKSGTAVASTSGTAIDFTGIPSWVKRVTVMFNGVSLNASANLLVQIGSGSFTTSGYASRSAAAGSSTTATTSSTAGFVSVLSTNNNGVWGQVQLLNVNSNNWMATHVFGLTDGSSTYSVTGGGNVALSGVLDRIRITSTSTDTFDAGSINILYEG